MSIPTEIRAPKSAYFASDGNYGSASHLVVVNVSDWNEQDWDLIEESSDDERPYVASQIAQRHYEQEALFIS